jgi:hypothetical protein
MKNLHVGENFIQRFRLKQSDGVTNLNLAACFSIVVALIVNETTIVTYTYLSDLELTEGDYPYELKLEGKSVLALKPGVLRAKVTIKVNNVKYPIEGKQTDIEYLEDLFRVIP